MKFSLALLLCSTLMSSFAFAKAKRLPLKSACEKEITAAGCDSISKTKALKQCLNSYKKEHSSFKLGKTCKAALGKKH